MKKRYGMVPLLQTGSELMSSGFHALYRGRDFMTKNDSSQSSRLRMVWSNSQLINQEFT